MLSAEIILVCFRTEQRVFMVVTRPSSQLTAWRAQTDRPAAAVALHPRARPLFSTPVGMEHLRPLSRG